MSQAFSSRAAIRCLALCALSLSACAAGETAGARVTIGLQVESIVEQERAPSEFTLETGWSVHLEEASVGLGPVYLRAPRREAFSLGKLLVPRANAHPEHAQTLTEGQVLGEFLAPVGYDVLSETPLSLGEAAVEAGQLDRISVVLSVPREQGHTRGHLAFVRGWAERDGRHVAFECGLDIEQDADELPEDLQARRRVDQIQLDDAPRLAAGDKLLVRVHPWRWFERVDFEAFRDGAEPCADAHSTFVAQWYLGIRRPEAFSAVVVRE